MPDSVLKENRPQVPIRPEGRILPLQAETSSPFEKERQTLRIRLSGKGSLLPHDHFAYTLAASIGRRLRLAKETELQVLDSEYQEAFYAPGAHSIYLGRGMFRYLQEQGLNITEDHIAAVEAHETEHAAVLDPTLQLEKSYKTRLFSVQNHAEEYRADRMAMQRLAKAGYNPRAMIDVLRTLLSNGTSLSHPASIDRVRHLEDFLANDTDPLAHTTKEYTPLTPQMKEWVAGNSEFHKETDKLIRMTPEQLRERLLQTQTQEEFWTTMYVKEHVDRVAAAKGLLQNEQELVHKTHQDLLLNDYLRYQLAHLRYFEETNIKKIPPELLQKKQELANALPREITSIDTGIDKKSETSRAQEFRQSVAGEFTHLEYVRQSLQDTDSKVTQANLELIAFLEKFSLPNDVAEIIDRYKKHFIGENDEQVIQELLKKNREGNPYNRRLSISDVIGMGYPAVETGSTDDLSTIQENMLMESISLPFPSVEIQSHFSSIFHSETGLPEEATQILSKIMLHHTSAEDWFRYLQFQEKDKFSILIRGAQKINDRATLHFSPLRSYHRSFAVSELTKEQVKKSYAVDLKLPYYDEANIGTTIGLDLIKKLPAHVLFYEKGYKGDYSKARGSFQIDGQPVDLTFDELDLVVEGKGIHDFERNRYLLKQYIIQAEKGNVDPKLKERLQTLHGEWISASLSNAEMIFLFNNSPWDKDTTLLALRGAVRNRRKHSFEELTPELVPLLTEMYGFLKNQEESEKKDFQKERQVGGDLTARELASMIFYLNLRKGVDEKKLDISQSFLEATRSVVENGMEFHFDDLLFGADTVLPWIDASYFHEVISLLKRHENLTDIETLTVYRLYQEVAENNAVKLDAIAVSGQVQPNKNVLDIVVLPNEKSIQHIVSRYRGKTIQWIVDNFPASALRDTLLVDATLQARAAHFSSDIRIAGTKFYSEIQPYLFSNPDTNGKKSAAFPFDTYGWRNYTMSKELGKNPLKWRKHMEMRREQDKFIGKGKVATFFPDLLRRRHSFLTDSYSHDLFPIGSRSGREYSSASAYQKLIAEELYAREATIFNSMLPFEQRLGIVTNTVAMPTVVRDVYLEALIEDEWKKGKSAQEKITLIQQVKGLFTEGSQLLAPFATDALRQEITIRPEIFTTSKQALDTVLYYLPSYSLARNHFLSLVEQRCSLSPGELHELKKLYISEEGQRNTHDDSPWTYVFSQLGSRSRTNNIAMVQWVLGSSSVKPSDVKNLEERFNGHLNTLPALITRMTPPEQEVFFKRMFLGREGILDLEVLQGGLKEESYQQKAEFLRDLSQLFLPNTMPQVELFRGLFVKVIDVSEPARASALLTKVLTRFYEAQQEGKIYPPEEVISVMLEEMGVVGKKVAQSIAELDWVPENYKRALQKAQQEGPTVSKHALLELADGAGLLDPDGPIQILSIDELLGSASNKQAAKLTIKVGKGYPQLAEGVHTVVGKFKRPSAQKKKILIMTCAY